MEQFRGTNINMHVRPDTKWPFDIVTYDDNGNEVFREKLYAHATSQKSFDDARNAVGFDFDEREEIKAVIERQLADAQIRAAAPELLQSLQNLYTACSEYATFNVGSKKAEFEMAAKAISKALGPSKFL